MCINCLGRVIAGSTAVGPAGRDAVLEYMWWCVPVGLSVLQLLLLRGFTLHSSYLAAVRVGRQQRMDGRMAAGKRKEQ